MKVCNRPSFFWPCLFTIASTSRVHPAPVTLSARTPQRYQRIKDGRQTLAPATPVAKARGQAIQVEAAARVGQHIGHRLDLLRQSSRPRLLGDGERCRSWSARLCIGVGCGAQGDLLALRNRHMAVKKTPTSSNCASGVDAPKRYSRHGSAINSTKLFNPGMAASGGTTRIVPAVELGRAGTPIPPAPFWASRWQPGATAAVSLVCTSDMNSRTDAAPARLHKGYCWYGIVSAADPERGLPRQQIRSCNV